MLAAVALAGLPAQPAEARVCEVSMHLDSIVLLAALQLDLDYSGTDGAIAMKGNKVDCAGEVGNAIAMFGLSGEVVTVSVLSLVGFTGPARLAHCTFDDPSGTAVEQDFDLSVTDSSDPDGKPVSHPRVLVEYGPCDDDTTTTSTSTTTTSTTTTSTTSTTTTSTTSTSTTTLPDDCGNGIVDGSEDCDDGNDENGDGCEGDCTGMVCGDANGNDSVQSSDALLVLRAATGQAVTCPVKQCDADGDQVLEAADSLRVLKRAVGQSVVMVCTAD